MAPKVKAKAKAKAKAIAERKSSRQNARREAMNTLNSLAKTVRVQEVPRDRPDLVPNLCLQLSGAALGGQLAVLSDARAKWLANGGCPLELAQDSNGASNPDSDDVESVPSGSVAMHRELPAGGKAFRLHSKAFMLTYNSLSIKGATWDRFVAWSKALAVSLKATERSATLEKSLRSTEKDRLHLHCYLSWKRGVGVDLRSLNKFVFNGIAPRVDVNSEHRGFYHWQRATDHGHFYVAVEKDGTLKVDTDYAAWRDYTPDASWISSLWKEHKLDHGGYERLSAKCRDGHARRMRDLEAVRRTEADDFVSTRKKEALSLLEPAMKKFKPYS